MYNSLFEYRINNRIVTRTAIRYIVGNSLSRILREAFIFWGESDSNDLLPFSCPLDKGDTLTITYINPEEATNAS